MACFFLCVYLSINDSLGSNDGRKNQIVTLETIDLNNQFPRSSETKSCDREWSLWWNSIWRFGSFAVVNCGVLQPRRLPKMIDNDQSISDTMAMSHIGSRRNLCECWRWVRRMKPRWINCAEIPLTIPTMIMFVIPMVELFHAKRENGVPSGHCINLLWKRTKLSFIVFSCVRFESTIVCGF